MSSGPRGDAEEFARGQEQFGENIYLLWGGGLCALRVFTGSSSGTRRASQMSIYLKWLLPPGQVRDESRQPFHREADGRKSPRPSVPVSTWQGF